MRVVKAAAAFIGAAAMAFAASSFAQVTSPGTGAPLPGPAQKAPPMQQGSADLSALARAVNELAARVDRLEGNLSAADVVGTYTLQYLQVALISNPPRTRVEANRSAPLGGIEHLSTAGTLDIAGNGQFSLTTRETGFFGNLGLSRMTGVDREATESGSWSFAGNALNLTFAGSSEAVALTGAVGGRLFISVGSGPDDGTSTLVLLVKNPR